MFSISWGVGLLILLAATPSPTRASQTKENLYLQAMKLYQQKKYSQAVERFRQILPLLQKEKASAKPNSRAWYALTLGQCVTLRKLAQIAWEQGKRRLSCRHYQAIGTLRKTLPEQRKKWASPGLQREILATSQTLQGPCQKVPSIVQLELSPAHTAVFQKTGPAWHKHNSRSIRTTQTRLTLRFQAKGFQTQIRKDLPIPRWQRITLKVTLKPRPKLTARRPPPRQRIEQRLSRSQPAPPFYKTWWFWTVTGVVVAGATTATVLALTARPRHVLKGNNDQEFYRLW